MSIVLTAGHVDHGKSSLVRALTGTDPDRLGEERRRGLTIDLGFASTTLPSGATVGFVDVPGHERFVANMLAGAGPGAGDAADTGTGAAVALFVVDATEGWRAQSEEHLRIVDVLGIRDGVVALTKCDLADDDTVELARLEVAERTAGSTLAAAPVVAVSARTGDGLEALRAELDRLVTALPGELDGGRPRLWIDRVFVVAGSGTVVTGTLAGGSLRTGAEVAIEPGELTARIRRIEQHGVAADVARPGGRVALNLAGVGHDELHRGMAVVEPGHWQVTSTFDATLTVFAAGGVTPGAPGLAIGGAPVGRRGAYVCHVGSAERPVTLRVVGADPVDPGSTGVVRLRLARPVVIQPGDRYVLRDAGRRATVGGGEVLDVAPVLPLRRARPDRSVARVVAERGWVTAEELRRLTGEWREPALGRWIVAPGAVAELEDEVRRRVVDAAPTGLDPAALDERRRLVAERLAQAGTDVVMSSGRLYEVGATTSLEQHPVIAELAAAGVAPEVPDVDRAVLRQLQRQGALVERDGIWFHPDAVTRAADAARQLLAADDDGFTVSQFRQRLGVSRRHAMPLLAELDARRITRRSGSLRTAGALLEAPARRSPEGT